MKSRRIAIARGGVALILMGIGGCSLETTSNSEQIGRTAQAEDAVIQFTSVPPDVTTTSCGTLNIGRPTATPSSTQITSNAPAKFPPGTTLVTWRAVSGASVATVTQRVTVMLTNDAACCPAGTNIILGTSNDDRINGTPGSDCILTFGGQDVIDGLGGDDYISAGDGEDVVSGGAGDDVLFGGSAGDSIFGDTGNDQLFGDDGDDRMFGNQGNDLLHGGQGNDRLFGNDGADALLGDDGDDTLDGGPGSDAMTGAGLHDSCFGDGGDVFAACERTILPILPTGKDFSPAEVNEIVTELQSLDSLQFRVVLPAFDTSGQLIGTQIIGTLPITDVRQVSKVRNILFDGDGNLQSIFTIFANDGGAGSHVDSSSGGQGSHSAQEVARRIDTIVGGINTSRFTFMLN
jgi:Ca2+-binding RTX toxin-like protein